MKRRVVVTGMGAITPVGNDVATTWQSLIAGKSGTAPITKFDASKFPVRFAAEVKGFNPLDYMERKEAKRADQYTQYAVAASRQAMTDASLVERNGMDPDRIGVIIGSGIGGLKSFEEQHDVYRERGVGKISPFFIPMFIADIAAGIVSMMFNAKGPNYATVSACATSAHAIGDAYRTIQYGDAAVMKRAVKDAALEPKDIQYINAHGTSTPANDFNETRAIQAVFGDQAKKVNVSSTKSATGHMLGAAGAVEAVISTLVVGNGIIPPTINYHHPDPELDLNYTPNTSVKREVNAVLSNSFGFGGHNSTLAIKRYEG